MITNTSSLEEQVSNMSKMMKIIMKHIKDQDAFITQLLNQKNYAFERSHMNSKKHQERDVSSSKGKDKVKKVYMTAEGTIPVEQLKEFGVEIIKDKKESNSKSRFSYSKPYIARIDNLAIPTGYQSPNFQHFDGKDNPKQHMPI